jgi:non-canonical (house-cleaning) NTP pyrophosphatase
MTTAATITIVPAKFILANNSSKPVIYLASTSEEKVKAINNGWSTTNSATAEMQLFNVPSGVPDQPLNEQIEQGARNRIQQIRREVGSAMAEDSYFVAFESGVWVNDGDDFGEEGTVCVIEHVQNGATKTTMMKSKCRKYPYFIIRDAIAEGVTDLKAQNKLVGAWFKEQPVDASVPKQSRTEVLTSVFMEALIWE